MKGSKKRNNYREIIDYTMKIPSRKGNGILRFKMSVDSKGKLAHYSMAYINHRICNLDNGRVLGYDNSHGHHHRHFMGVKEPIDFENYEALVERFETEWRLHHEKVN